MIDPGQFKAHVIRPALQKLATAAGLTPLWSPAAETLLLGTALQESALTYIDQLGDSTGFGGHGFYQDEPEDLSDLLKNFVFFRPNLKRVIDAGRNGGDPVLQLEWDMQWASWVCRLHYYRSPNPVPNGTDAAGMAAFYKADYNTPLGLAQPGQVLANFQRAIAVA